MTNKQSEKTNVMLNWGDVLRNNPTFDNVYDYVQEYFNICGHTLDMNNESDRKFIQSICEGYKVKK